MESGAIEREPRLREPSQRVSPRARLMWQLGNLTEGLLTIAALTVAVLAWDAVDLRWWMVAGAVAVLVAYVAVVPQWRYLVHRWEVTDTAVYTQTGWWARERRIAPMSRIQTVDYAEGPVARLFGLATVTVTTASAAGALQIAGLAKDRAQQLVDELTLKADAVEGDAT
jgi:membrane protein YdbS with pleckstrin-like domain